MIPICVLVVAKAPVPGLAKTRLAAGVGDAAAADIAAAALLDTLDAVADAPVAQRMVALTGELEQGVQSAEIRHRLEDFTVIAQRGDGFAERLANAHADAGRSGLPVLQIGMDTPQVSAGLLTECGRALLATDAVLGLARDGGWWVLGVRDGAMAGCLRSVPMSRPDTGALTLVAMQDRGIDVDFVAALTDVDTVADIDEVRRACAPDSRFVRATRGL